MDGEERHFASPKEEAEYWKGKALQYKQSYEFAKQELGDFQIRTRDLQAELDAQLEQQKSRNEDLSGNNQRLQIEVDTLRKKLEGEQAAIQRQLTESMVKQVHSIGGLAKYLGEVERTKRTAMVSLQGFESRLNMAIERNTFLESKLEELKLAITIQQSKDSRSRN